MGRACAGHLYCVVAWYNNVLITIRSAVSVKEEVEISSVEQFIHNSS